MKIDMHCHVSEGSFDSKVKVRDYIRLLIDQGFDGMVITDHNTYNGYRYWRDHVKGKEFQDFVVLKGVEYDTLDGGHMLVIMPPQVKLKSLELRGMEIKTLVEIVSRHGGVLGPAHPFGEKYMSFCNSKCYKLYPQIAQRFHFVEAYNACEPIESNEKAEVFAKTYSKLKIGGSDAHREVCAGWGYVEFQESIKDELDLIRLIREKVDTKCGGKLYGETTKDKLGRAKIIMAYSFFVYNASGALWRKRTRRLKGREEDPVTPIDPIEIGSEKFKKIPKQKNKRIYR